MLTMDDDIASCQATRHRSPAGPPGADRPARRLPPGAGPALPRTGQPVDTRRYPRVDPARRGRALRSGGRPPGALPRRGSVLGAVVNAVAERIGIDAALIDPDKPLSGIEPMELLLALTVIEEAYVVLIPDHLLFGDLTARELADLVSELAEG